MISDLRENVNHEQVQLSQYADDVSLRSTNDSMAVAYEPLQEGINVIEAWCKRWQVVLNPTQVKTFRFYKMSETRKVQEGCKKSQD